MHLHQLPEPQQTRLRDTLAGRLGCRDWDLWTLQAIEPVPGAARPGTYRAILTRADGAQRRVTVSAEIWGSNLTTWERNTGPDDTRDGREIRRLIRDDLQPLLPVGADAELQAVGDGGHLIIEITGLREPDAELGARLLHAANAYNWTYHPHDRYDVSLVWETRTPEEIQRHAWGLRRAWEAIECDMP